MEIFVPYSIWLMPAGDVYDRFAGLISQLSREYDSIPFGPHITLLPLVAGEENEIIDKTSRLASLIHPFEISLAEADYYDEYYRCLFIRVRETPGIIAANRTAKEIFDRMKDPPFEPHLSLLYGHIDPGTKDEIITRIGKDSLINFEVNSIHLFRTGEEIESWQRVEEFPLK